MTVARREYVELDLLVQLRVWLAARRGTLTHHPRRRHDGARRRCKMQVPTSWVLAMLALAVANTRLSTYLRYDTHLCHAIVILLPGLCVLKISERKSFFASLEP